VADRVYLSIGEVLSLLREEFPDITISKIRFLESQGLLDPERTPSGYRKFYEADVERLRWILRQQREHFLPLKVIKGRLAEPHEAAGPGSAAAATGTAAPGAGPSTSTPDGAGQGATSPGSAMTAEDVLSAGASSVTMTLDELATAAALPPERVEELERFGLITSRPVGGTAYYDEEAFVVARLAAGFLRYGVEARHLRIYKNAAEREAGFFEQVVVPLMKQRNPGARRQALDALAELASLGHGLRAAMLRQALRDYTTT
jgi:DNA-binding transcriptional MerR regulator